MTPEKIKLKEIEGQIQGLMAHHQQSMLGYDEERREHEESGQSLTCDYYLHKTRMSEYHRGAYNALLELHLTT